MLLHTKHASRMFSSMVGPTVVQQPYSAAFPCLLGWGLNNPQQPNGDDCKKDVSQAVWCACLPLL
jgi:hypothetical protein